MPRLWPANLDHGGPVLDQLFQDRLNCRILPSVHVRFSMVVWELHGIPVWIAPAGARPSRGLWPQPQPNFPTSGYSTTVEDGPNRSRPENRIVHDRLFEARDIALSRILRVQVNTYEQPPLFTSFRPDKRHPSPPEAGKWCTPGPARDKLRTDRKDRGRQA